MKFVSQVIPFIYISHAVFFRHTRVFSVVAKKQCHLPRALILGVAWQQVQNLVNQKPWFLFFQPAAAPLPTKQARKIPFSDEVEMTTKSSKEPRLTRSVHWSRDKDHESYTSVKVQKQHKEVGSSSGKKARSCLSVGIKKLKAEMKTKTRLKNECFLIYGHMPKMCTLFCLVHLKKSVHYLFCVLICGIIFDL